MRAAYASHNQELYVADVGAMGDIAELCRSDGRVEALTGDGGELLFWFSVVDQGRPGRVNRRATELLLAVSSFTGRTVPLLCGDVVVTGRGRAGEIAELSCERIGDLADMRLGWLDDVRLSRRLRRVRRRYVRECRVAQEQHVADLLGNGLGSLGPGQRD